MTGKVVGIERIEPRDGFAEEPYRTADGYYRLANPRHGAKKHHAENAEYTDDLAKAARMIEAGYHIWMHRTGKRPSLIAPEKIKIVRK